MKRWILLGLVLLMAHSVAVWARPAIPPGDDSYVDVNSPDDNFNGNLLEVSASTARCEPTSMTFLQWNLLHIPAYSIVHTATLTLTVNYAMNADAAQVALYATGDTWSEDTLTYVNAPAKGVKIESQPVPAMGHVLTFNSEALRAYLEEQLAGNQRASFVLFLEGVCSTGYTFVLFNDRESGTDIPDLYLETEARPVDLAIGKTGPAVAFPGQAITYTLVYTNVGNIPVNYALITDVLPIEVRAYDDLDPFFPPGNTLTWEIFDLAPGDSGVLTITAIVSPTFTGLLTNTATIATLALEDDLTDNVSLPVVTEVRAPDLALHKSGPATAYPGDVIEYTLVYTNIGNAAASYITVTDVLPPHITVFDHTGTVMLPSLDNTLIWQIPSLAPGDSGILTMTAIISPTFTGLLTNTATIATASFEGDLTNNVAQPVVTAVRAPDLAIHKTGPATAYPGDVIEYTLVYTNVGDALAPYVTITDLLPLNVQLYDHTGTIILPHPAGQLTWEVFNLAPNAGGTLTVSVVISPTFTGWLTNTVTIATTAPELVTDNNTGVAWTQVLSPPVVWHYLYLPLVMRAVTP